MAGAGFPSPPGEGRPRSGRVRVRNADRRRSGPSPCRASPGCPSPARGEGERGFGVANGPEAARNPLKRPVSGAEIAGAGSPWRDPRTSGVEGGADAAATRNGRRRLRAGESRHSRLNWIVPVEVQTEWVRGSAITPLDLLPVPPRPTAIAYYWDRPSRHVSTTGRDRSRIRGMRPCFCLWPDTECCCLKDDQAAELRLIRPSDVRCTSRNTERVAGCGARKGRSEARARNEMIIKSPARIHLLIGIVGLEL